MLSMLYITVDMCGTLICFLLFSTPNRGLQGAIETHPGAMEPIEHEFWSHNLSLKPWYPTIEPWISPLTLGGPLWSREGSPWAAKAQPGFVEIQPWSRRGSPCSLGGSHWSLEGSHWNNADMHLSHCCTTLTKTVTQNSLKKLRLAHAGQWTVFFFISWRAGVCWPLHCLCCPTCIFERCLDLNPGSCRTNQAHYQLFLATHLPYLANHLPT